jgi:hypothetical protein
MYDELEYMYNTKEEGDSPEEEKESEEDVVNHLSDITDNFLDKEDFPGNFDIKVIENSHIKEKLYKLSSFLVMSSLLRESDEILKLANYSILEEAESLRIEIKNRIFKILSDAYSEKNVGWKYETDFNQNITKIGFDGLETDFVRLMDEGLSALDDLDIDTASEVLWAASGLVPEGHHDFDENLTSLLLFQNDDLNRQADRPGRDEVQEIRGEISKKFSEWIEYRAPNFESLESLELEELVNVIVEAYPELDAAVDDIYEEWEEFLDGLSEEQKLIVEPIELEPYVPEETVEYTDTSFPKHYEQEEPVGTSGDLERLEEELFPKNFNKLEEYL